MSNAWIRGGAPRWSWLCVWAIWSQLGCYSGTLRTPHTAAYKAGPVSLYQLSTAFVEETKSSCHQTYMYVSVLQEAVSTGDPELVQLVLQYRDFKRATERLAGIPELLSKLRQVKLVHCPPFGEKPRLFPLPHLKFLVNICRKDVSFTLNQSNWMTLKFCLCSMFLCCLPGTGLLCGDEVGVHQLG